MGLLICYTKLLYAILFYRFPKWPEFEEKHSRADKTGYMQLHKQLEAYLLRRVKKDVEKSLPAKVWKIVGEIFKKRSAFEI